MRHWKYRSLYWDYVNRKWDWLLKKQPAPHVCAVRGCNKARELEKVPNKRKLYETPICNCCKRRRWRINNPFHYMYSELKRSAKRRGIYFHLHRGEFIQFCIDNQLYWNSAKFTADSLTVDRIDNDLGYTINNIQVLSNRDNVAKNNKLRKEQQTEFNEDDPF